MFHGRGASSGPHCYNRKLHEGFIAARWRPKSSESGRPCSGMTSGEERDICTGWRLQHRHAAAINGPPYYAARRNRSSTRRT